MKKVFFVILLMTSISLSKISACDICGCGVNNYYIGILPQFNHKFFGARYHFNSFNTRLRDDPTQFSKDFYQTIEVWGGWNIGKRFQLLTFIPVNFNHQESDEGIKNLKGLGDVVVLGNYKLFDVSSISGNNTVFSQQLWIGGGLKLPTGKFNVEETDPDVASLANGQVGSGSVDVLLDAMYNVRINKVGINTTASYKINSPNSDNYRFGNKLSLNSLVYYPIMASRTVISPNLGLLYERTKGSELQRSKVDLTGGYVVQGSLGAEISFNKLSVGCNLQVPVTQNFAEDQTKEKLKGTAHMTLAF